MKILIIFLLFIVILIFVIYYFTARNDINQNSEFLHKKLERLNTINAVVELGSFLEKESYTSSVEVGVQKGLFADMILSRWKSCKRYVMVDPWLQQRYYDDSANVPNDEQNNRFNNAMNIVNKYSNSTVFVILRMKSNMALNYLKNEQFDFIYLDARHDYLSVKNDINWYYPLVRSGGVLAGDDYKDAPKAASDEWLLDENGKKNSEYKAVKSAVDEFVKENGLNLKIIESVWIIVKM